MPPIAAHYGSVRLGTYAVAVIYFAMRDIIFEEYLPLFLKSTCRCCWCCWKYRQFWGGSSLPGVGRSAATGVRSSTKFFRQRHPVVNWRLADWPGWRGQMVCRLWRRCSSICSRVCWPSSCLPLTKEQGGNGRRAQQVRGFTAKQQAAQRRMAVCSHD